MTFSDLNKQAHTLVDLLRWRAAHQPDRDAYTFLLDTEGEEISMGYAALDLRARTIGALLQQAGLAGERALLLYPPGVEYIAAFFGCLYAGVTAVPAYPPHPAKVERTFPRLHAIAVDASPAIALTTSAIQPNAEKLFSQSLATQGLQWLATDLVADTPTNSWRQPELDANTLAFLQYTSGSTATPKGVMLTHHNLLANLEAIRVCFDITAEDRSVIWLPPYHDMGLIGGILQPLYAGFPVTLMAPVAFLQNPMRWLQTISRNRATISGGPNFAYELCVQRIGPEQRAGLDLSNWCVAFNGAEPIQAATLKSFASTFAGCGFRPEAFYPCYGLAEATLIVSGGQRTAPVVVRHFSKKGLEQNRLSEVAPDHQDGRPFVGCGQQLAGHEIAIVDPGTQGLCPVGQIGEIWIAGPSIAQGYWNKPEENRQTFGVHIQATDRGGFFRSGDLGFFIDGELFVASRLKDLIIIRGQNHYPQDIEATATKSHPGLQAAGAAAFSIDFSDGEHTRERLVIVHEVERHYRKADPEQIFAAIRRAVAEQHEVQAYAIVLIKTGSLPKTSSGKVQRRACRQMFLDGKLDVIAISVLGKQDAAHAPASTHAVGRGRLEALCRSELLALPATEQMARLVADLHRRVAETLQISPADFDDGTPVSTLGLDSLAAVQLAGEIERDFKILIPMADFLQEHSMAEIAAQIWEALCHPDSTLAWQAIQPKPRQVYPLSPGQQALWFLNRLAPESAAYNLARAFRVRGHLEIAALQQALQSLIERHSVLQTAFLPAAERPVQKVQTGARLDFVLCKVADWNDTLLQQQLSQEAQRPFGLEHAPLLRVRVYEKVGGEYIVLLVFHHIVSDFWSFAILFDELDALYRAAVHGEAARLEPAAGIQYADYIQWQDDLLAGQEGERLWRYWQHRLAGHLPVMQWTSDHPRPAIQTYGGAACHFRLTEDLSRRLSALSRAHGATLYMTLLAAFKVLLHRYTGQTDILVGSPTTGRSRAEWAKLVGYFVNPLPIRTQPSGELSFAAFLQQVRQRVLEAFEHQDFPFALMVERLKPERDPSYSPIFQTMFVLQKAPAFGATSSRLDALALAELAGQVDLADLAFESFALEQRIAQFDLTLGMVDVAGGLAGTVEYNTDLFEAATIERLVAHFCNLLGSIVANPAQEISRLPLLTDAEYETLLVALNQTHLDYTRQRGLHQLFESQAMRTPDAIALQVGTQQCSYRELNTRANRLAHILRQRGIGPERLVGVCLRRDMELPVALLAVLKAGGAYIPLDPAYPSERIAWMLEDSRASLLLTQQNLLAQLPNFATPYLCLDAAGDEIALAPTDDPQPGPASQHLAYVLYTSGSTGRPKGVAIAHQSAVALLEWANTVFSPADLACVLASTSICFDLSIFEFFAPWSCGGRVVLADNLLQFAHLPGAQTVTLVNTVPSAMADLLHSGSLPEAVRVVNLAGEPLPGKLVQQIYRHATVQRVFNLYGPSEDTTYSTFAHIARNEQRAPAIGRPIANTQAYLLDAQLQPVAMGLPGELYLGGDGLARGYLNRPGLTAERFVPDPFSKLPGARLYKTGDLARYAADGALEYLGRLDYQVKIRGFRIELGEIEAWLGRHPAIRTAAVAVREDTPGDKRLVAYVVPDASLGRVPTQEACQVEFFQDMHGQQFEIVMENLSYGGACLVGVPDGWERGQTVRLRLQLAGTDGEFSLTGSIVWHHAQRAGVQFDTPADDKAQLRQTVEHMLQSLSPNALLQASQLRAPVRYACRVASNDGDTLELMVENLSGCGACLVGVPDTWVSGQKVRLWLTLPETAQEYSVPGHVAWRHARTVGIVFEIGPERQESLVALLKSLNSGPGLSVSQLRHFLKQYIPDYMVPATFMLLEAMPLTPNGKIDRRALPAPQQIRPTIDQIFVAPRTLEEEKLVEIWQEVLKTDRIGVHDNFFDLGGHSLLATQVMSRVRDVFGAEPPLHALFEQPTVAGLALAIQQSRQASPEIPSLRPRQRQGNARAEQILANIVQLSDEEAQQALREKELGKRHG